MSKTLTAILFITIVSSALTAQAAKQGHWRWTDENGTVQYSDRPPEGVESEFIEFAAPRSSARSKSQGPVSSAAEEQQAGKTFDEMEVLPEKDPELCRQAQNNLKALEAARIRITEPDGTKRILTEDEKETQRANANKFIELHCD